MPASPRDRLAPASEADLEATLRRIPAEERRRARASAREVRRMRVLYVAARPDAPYRYRCVHGAEQLRAAGAVANVVSVDAPDLLERVGGYSTVVLFRLPWSDRVAQLVQRARDAGASIGFEVDDLVFDPAVEPLMPFLARLTPSARGEYHALFAGLAQTLAAADFCIASTETIGRHLRATGKPVVVHPNLLSTGYVELARVVAPLRRALLRQPMVAYLSGSPTHDGDLAAIARAIAAALRAAPGLSLLLVGPVQPPPELAVLPERLVRMPYLEHRVYPWLMAQSLAALAPIEAVNDFSNAKSPLKVFEAGLFGVPVIASPAVPYRESIEPGRTGLLASAPDEWTEAIVRLADRAESLRMGSAARRLVLQRFTPTAWAGVLAHELLAHDGRAVGRRPRLAPLRLRGEERSPEERLRHELHVVRASARVALAPPRPAPGLEAEEVRTPAALLQAVAAAPRRGRMLLQGNDAVGLVLVDREHPLRSASRDPGTVLFERGRGGGSSIHAAHADAQLYVRVTEVPPAPWTLLVRMRATTTTAHASAQLFWSVDAEGTFREEESVRVPIQPDGAWHVHAIALPPAAPRRAGIVAWRFDPLDVPGEAEVSLVALLASGARWDAPGDVLGALARRFGIAPPAPGSQPPGLDEAVARAGHDAGVEPFLFVAESGRASAEAFERATWRISDRLDADVLELLADAGPRRIAVLRRRAVPPIARPVDVVVPVYNAREYTRRCVESVLRHATGDWRLVLVNDASTEPGIVEDLDAFARADPRVVVLHNERNRGFVATANRGMRHAGDRDVLLLNSDTEVLDGFLDRLRAAATDPKTGILTPFSNNATICSIPDFPRDNPIPEGYTPEQFGRLVAATSARRRPDLPTGVGFCLYLRSDVLARVGYFDEETFGRGYGEENDVCQRARKAGFRVALCDDVFVYHKGKASFGAEGWVLQDDVNAKRLEAKHPGYHAEIARFVESNPLAPLHARLRFHLRRLRPGGEHAILYLLHASPWGDRPGGTEFHVRDLLRALALPRAVVAWPAPNGVGTAEVLDGDVDAARILTFPAGEAPAAPLHVRAALRRAIELLGVRAVHVHHLLRWPYDVVGALEDAGVPWISTHHDYYAVCPNWNLYDYERQAPCPCRTEPATALRCLERYARATGAGGGVDVEQVRAEHRAGMDLAVGGARALVFPSDAARAVFDRQMGPTGAPRVVIPHGYDVHATAERAAPGERLRVAIMGEVAYPLKGAERYLELLATTRHLAIEWHVFGDVSLFHFEERLRATGTRLVLHGRYARDTLPGLLVRHGIDLSVILPNWDETFSYVLSESLVAGVPSITSRRGALAERVTAAGAGVAVDGVEEAARALEQLVADRTRLAGWTERARAFRHRSVAESADEHRRLYASLGWLDEAPLRWSEAGSLASLYALAAAAAAPPPPVIPRGPLRRLARATLPEPARRVLSAMMARAFPGRWKRAVPPAGKLDPG